MRSQRDDQSVASSAPIAQSTVNQAPDTPARLHLHAQRQRRRRRGCARATMRPGARERRPVQPTGGGRSHTPAFAQRERHCQQHDNTKRQVNQLTDGVGICGSCWDGETKSLRSSKSRRRQRSAGAGARKLTAWDRQPCSDLWVIIHECKRRSCSPCSAHDGHARTAPTHVLTKLHGGIQRVLIEGVRV